MKVIKQTGLIIFLTGLAFFIGTIFIGSFSLKQNELDVFFQEQQYKSTVLKGALEKAVVNVGDLNIFEFSSRVRKAYATSNQYYDVRIAEYNKTKNWKESLQR